MKLLFLTALFAYFITPGTGLDCFRCAITPQLCVSQVTCNGTDSCFSRKIKVGPVTFFNSGCTAQENCGKTVEEKIGLITYTVKTECCTVDFCNGATAAQLSLLAISVMALAWFVGFQ